MAPVNKIQVIGINVCGDPLSEENRRRIAAADVVAAGLRHLDLIPFFQGKTIQITADIHAVLAEIGQSHAGNRRIVVLATGDPLLFGIGNTLIAHFGLNAVVIHPGISAVQVALNRLAMKTDQAVILSRHGGRANDFGELLHHALGVILTSNGPSVFRVVTELTARYPFARQWRGHVCQCLGMASEAIESRLLKDFSARRSFDSPNLLVLENPHPLPSGGLPAAFGRSDDVYAHDEGMITHPETRAITLSKLNLSAASIIWDVGAGSGSVGIEAALLNPHATVFAIEKNLNRLKNIMINKEKQRVQNLFPVHGDALALCSTLPAPGSVFIGGGGASLGDILSLCHACLLDGGTMVINTVTIESTETVHRFFNHIQKKIRGISVQVSRLRPLAGYHTLKPDNPINIFEIKK